MFSLCGQIVLVRYIVMADTDTESDIFICRRTLRCQILKILSRIYGVIKDRPLVCKTFIDKNMIRNGFKYRKTGTCEEPHTN